MKHKRLLLAVAVLAGGFALPAVAFGGSQEADLYDEPPESVLTVPPRDAGKDFKDNPAPPEPEPTSDTTPLSAEEKKAIYESIDPEDSPHIRVCVNPDGSGSAQFLTPADPNAPENPLPPGEKEFDLPKIKDKESCE